MAFNTVNKRKTKPSPGPLATKAVPTGLTGNGAPGYAYEDKSALFQLAVNSFFGQKKFYESAKAGDGRFVALVRKVAQVDPMWMINFTSWLRASGNMRASAVVASVEAALVMSKQKWATYPWVSDGVNNQGPARQMAKAGIGRADEIGEAMAYYEATYPNTQLPKPLKRAWADALVEQVNQYTAAKYDGDSKAWKLADLINVLHPKAREQWQADLFGYLVAKQYGEVEIPASLTRLAYRDSLMKLDVAARRILVNSPQGAQVLKDAGMTWEALAGWLQGPMDKAAWEAIIPSMGYMALLRNLRNFDEAGVSGRAFMQAHSKLADPEQVKWSKQFPFRFLAAYKAAPNLRWASALSMALDASLDNIPKLAGRTLVLVDTSGSMNVAFSEHSEMKRWDAAALFGIALGLSSEGVDVVSYSNHGKVFGVRKGADTLGELKRWGTEGYNLNGGTNTFGVLQGAYRNHDRVIILTDEQVNYRRRTYPNFQGLYEDQSPLDKLVGPTTHVFSFNLAGYQYGQAPTGKFRHTFGGLTDACFPMIDMIERAQAGRWPWEQVEA